MLNLTNITISKSYLPQEGDERDYKDGRYRFTNGHWEKLDKKLENKLEEINKIFQNIINKHKDSEFFTYLKLRNFNDEIVDFLLSSYFKQKNKRFIYNKKLNKKFIINFALKLEEIFSSLPKEHLLNNSSIQSFDIRFDRKEGYAFYQNKRIIFSKSYIEGILDEKRMVNLEPDKVLEIGDSNEMKSTLLHEIGHGVWETLIKVKKSNIEKLEDFSELCGYGKYNPLLYDVTPTGRARKIKRNKEFNLITDYSEINPQEAFSEYYSFYSLYPNLINEITNNQNVNLKETLRYRCTDVTYESILQSKEIFKWIKKEIFENLNNFREE